MSTRTISWDEPAESLRRHLGSGGVLAIPTESSYGLAADPRSAEGVEAIYRIKERDRGKPLPVVAADAAQTAVLGIDPSSPEVLAVADLWPASLSVVLPARGPNGPWPASADGATLAVRVPAHPRLRELLRTVEFPLTATSANAAGRPPILDPRDLEPLLAGHGTWIVDGGVLPGGEPSTLVAWADGQWRVIRAGRFPVTNLPSVPGS